MVNLYYVYTETAETELSRIKNMLMALRSKLGTYEGAISILNTGKKDFCFVLRCVGEEEKSLVIPIKVIVVTCRA